LEEAFFGDQWGEQEKLETALLSSKKDVSIKLFPVNAKYWINILRMFLKLGPAAAQVKSNFILKYDNRQR